MKYRPLFSAGIIFCASSIGAYNHAYGNDLVSGTNMFIEETASDWQVVSAIAETDFDPDEVEQATLACLYRGQKALDYLDEIANQPRVRRSADAAIRIIRLMSLEWSEGLTLSEDGWMSAELSDKIDTIESYFFQYKREARMLERYLRTDRELAEVFDNLDRTYYVWLQAITGQDLR